MLNAAGVAAACVGNHDLDFGLSNFEALARACSFPWLLSNVLLASGVSARARARSCLGRRPPRRPPLPQTCRTRPRMRTPIIPPFSVPRLPGPPRKRRRAGDPLPGTQRTALLEHAGVMVGLMGIAEEEW